MKKIFILLYIAVVMTLISPSLSSAEDKYTTPQEDSKELKLQDMLMLFLLPHINKAVNEYYSQLLTESPAVYPYFIDVIQIERLNGFRGFHFIITLEVYPTVGPHISVGKDQITFEVAPIIPNTVRQVKFNHLKTEKLPPNWQHIIKKT